jgi:rubrerythrin
MEIRKNGEPIQYKCLMCGYICSDKIEFIKHLVHEKYIKRIDKYTKCSKCDFKFGTQDSDIQHICKLIDPPIECIFCGKKYRNTYSANVHHVKCGKFHTKKMLQENRCIVRICKIIKT